MVFNTIRFSIHLRLRKYPLAPIRADVVLFQSPARLGTNALVRDFPE